MNSIPGSIPRTRGRRLTASVTAVAATVAMVCGTVAVGAVTAQSAAAATYTPPSTRQQINLNSGWRFIKKDVGGAQATSFNDGSWTAVSIPHTWNATDGADGGANYYQGTGWYRRHYTPPAPLAGKALYLQFAGANQVADVWINGTYLGQHKGGYARFRFSATKALKVGADNVIAVKVNNATTPDVGPQRADYTFQGGIYRNVTLWAVDPLEVTMLDYAGPGVYLRQRAVSSASATVEVTTKVANTSSASRSVAVRTVITNESGDVVSDQSAAVRTIAAGASASVVQTAGLTQPHLWNGLKDPYLYQANVEVRDAATGKVVDSVTEPLGLRSFSVDPNRGFFLNGTSYPLHGVDLHQDWAGVGWAKTDADTVTDYNLIKELGANTVRLAHYQHDQKEYNLADQNGLVLWSEIPNIDFTTDSAAYTANTEQSLYELIRQNYNHPSVVFWGIGNEQRSNNTATNKLLTALAGIITAQDPDRLSTYASAAVADTGAVNGHTDVNGYNKYFGWYDGVYGDLGPWADKLHAAGPTRRVAVSEYGAGASITQHALNPSRSTVTSSFHPEEYQALLHENSYKQLAARPYIWGTYVWNMFDFASDGRAEGGQRGINDKGLVTRDRATRKDAFYWYKANWAATPTLYITSRRWTKRTAAKTDVKVYSNAGTVTATLNGSSLGSKNSTSKTFTWSGVTLKKGANTVKVTATINGTAVTDTVSWTLS